MSTNTVIALGVCKQIQYVLCSSFHIREKTANLSCLPPLPSSRRSLLVLSPFLPSFIHVFLCTCLLFKPSVFILPSEHIKIIFAFLPHSCVLQFRKPSSDSCLSPASSLSQSSVMVDTDLCVSNLPVEHLVQDDEAVRGARWIPFNQHIGRFGSHYLMGHRAWDVVCFLCRYQT